MTIFSGSGFYEMDFQSCRFQNLQYIRMDSICDVLHVTMKNVITGEMLTFEINGINWIRKMNISFDIVPNK
jgi:hypothetical protein